MTDQDSSSNRLEGSKIMVDCTLSLRTSSYTNELDISQTDSTISFLQSEPQKTNLSASVVKSKIKVLQHSGKQILKQIIDSIN